MPIPGFEELAVVVTTSLRLRLDPDRLDVRYLSRWLTQLDRSLISAKCRQWRQPATSTVTLLMSLQIPLPPLAEQRRIAEVLDRAEALRAKRRAALAQLDSLTQSLFLDLFGDPATIRRAGRCKSLGFAKTIAMINSHFRSQRTRFTEFTDDGFADVSLSTSRSRIS